MTFDGLEKNPETHLVAVLGPEGDGSILGVAGLGSVASQNSHVCGSYAQQPTLSHRLKDVFYRHGP